MGEGRIRPLTEGDDRLVSGLSCLQEGGGRYNAALCKPSKEDIAGAESMSQEEFNRRMDQYLKDRQRKNFRG